ncbi:cold shock domain-containing protein [Nocardia tengchongensis]|uniref:cold shock domain-containing protein n=1 Tax=Nocardia tengchongensis TaxID=2055889 RepID=UPI003676A746
MTTTAPTPTDRNPATAADTTRYDPHTRGKGEPRWQHGQCAWFNTEKGFGFLTPDTGPAVFVDYQVIDVPGFKTLRAGQSVVFTAADTGRGPEATRVVPYTRAHTTAPIPSYRPHRARQHRSRCRHHTP